MIEEKINFIKTGVFELLMDFSESQSGKWGVMNAQQMVEHLRDFFRVSTGELHFDLAVPEEHLPKYKTFLMSDKEFRENTKAPDSVLGEEPLALRFENLKEAQIALMESVENFFQYFNEHPGIATLHPAFGYLNFEEWVMLHYKHVRHHLKQFSITV